MQIHALGITSQSVVRSKRVIVPRLSIRVNLPVGQERYRERKSRLARLCRRITVAGGLVLSAGVAACSDPAPSAAPSPPRSPSPAAPEVEVSPGDPTGLRLRLVPVANIRNAVSLAVNPVSDQTYVASRGGRVYRLRGSMEAPQLVLNLSSQVSCCEAEQGMFALVFSPDGTRAYLSFTDTSGDLRVAEFLVDGGVLVERSRRDLLLVSQPSPRHHGGSLAIGPAGHLYIGVGDGSFGSDPRGVAQSLESLRGKLLRIDPRPTAGRPYGIPSDNPFVSRPGARPEIFALGLRNPWRFSFDRDTGDVWIGDVGQYTMEEVDFLPAGEAAGANLAWNRLEGRRRFSGASQPEDVVPIIAYEHAADRCAVIGGYVYRGAEIRELAGWYLFADLCDGRLRAALQQGGMVTSIRDLNIRLDGLVSFAEDAEGEIYLLSLYRGVHRLERG